MDKIKKRFVTVDPDPMVESEIRDRFAKAVYSKRVENGWTQGELALMSGTSRPSIIHYENRKSSPNLLMAVKLCSVLDLSLDEIFFGKKSGT